MPEFADRLPRHLSWLQPSPPTKEIRQVLRSTLSNRLEGLRLRITEQSLRRFISYPCAQTEKSLQSSRHSISPWGKPGTHTYSVITVTPVAFRLHCIRNNCATFLSMVEHRHVSTSQLRGCARRCVVEGLVGPVPRTPLAKFPDPGAILNIRYAYFEKRTD